MIHDINKLKIKNCMIISIKAEKVFDKIQHLLMIFKKSLQKVGLKESNLNIKIQDTYDKSTANIILNGEELKEPSERNPNWKRSKTVSGCR